MRVDTHYYKHDLVIERAEKAEREDSFLGAFGNKQGSDKRKQRRARKGWAS